MSWAELFERAAAYDATIEDVEAALAERRHERTGESGALDDADASENP